MTQQTLEAARLYLRPARTIPRGRSEAQRDPNRWPAIWMAVLVTITIPSIIAVAFAMRPTPPAHPWSQAALALGVDPERISLGEMVYRTGCAPCHGQDANGIRGLGKPLRNSAFVQSHTDAELLTLIAEGRPPSDPANTTGMLMPARAGRGLTDDVLASIIAYLRAIQDHSQPTVAVDAWAVRAVADAGAEPEAKQRADGGPEAIAGPSYDLFVTACSSCHGSRGQGMEGLGKPLAGSAFVQSKTDADLITFVKTGRPIWDADNTTGVDMPPKGGNPALTDDELAEIVRFIRSIQPNGSEQSNLTVRAPGEGAAEPAEHSLFTASCSSCHGPRGQGMEGLGKPIAGSAFVRSKTDADLIAFIKTGRPIWDADNTTGVDMPPKGGNPALTDDELAEIVRFIRSFNDASGGR